jgi:periplasmic protein TonB
VANADPIYPAAERASGVGGVVTMDAVIGVDGVVTNVDNLSGADAALQNAAADAVRQWQYSQTLLNCQPIPVHMKVTVNFRGGA